MESLTVCGGRVSAQPGRLHADADLAAGAGLRIRPFLDHQRLAEGPDDCCLHHMLLKG